MPRLSAYPVFLIYSGASALFFSTIFTINLVYHITTVGLNPLQLVLVGTLLETTVFLLEVPTGIVADVYSRRLSVIVGVALIGCGFIVEGAFPLFGTVLLAQVIWGAGATFISGASDAWIVDELGEDRAGPVFLRASQVGQVMGLLGTGLSVALASISITLPIWLGGLLFLGLALFLALFMPEEGFTPTPPEERESFRQMRQTLAEGIRLVRVRPVLLIILAVSALHGAFSEGMDRLWRAHLLAQFTLPGLGAVDPVVWFGIIGAVGSVLSIVLTEVIRRRLDMANAAHVRGALSALYAGVSAAAIGFALVGSFPLALLILWTAQMLRAAADPIWATWTNQHVDSGVRATVLSMNAQANAVGQIGGGPVVGWVGTTFTLRAALVMAGLLLLPASGLLRGARARSAEGPPPESAGRPVGPAD